MQPVLVVTRPQPEANHWVDQLQTQGVHSCALPLMEITPSRHPSTQAALALTWAQLPHYHALMFVSGNAVRHFFAQLQAAGMEWPGHVRCWSPGPGTSAALQTAGIPEHHIDQPAAHAAQFDSEALWACIQAQAQAGRRVLIVRGGDGHATQGQGRTWLTEALQAQGVEVDFACVYERHAPALTPDLLQRIQALRQQRAVWLFSSSECVQQLVFCNPQWPWHTHTALATHPRIAAQAKTAGFGRVIGTQPTLNAITASIKSLHDHP